MNKKAISWLYQELPELVAKGILSEHTAEKLKSHYGPIEKNQGTHTFLLIFGVIGVLLVGLGIILLIAHNWPQFTRTARLSISVGLLFAAQAATGIVLRYKRDSQTLREATAALHMLMIGAAMALVGQTYHLAEDTDSFILIWMLLSFPLMYLMRANIVAVMYIIGISFWAAHSHPYPEKQYVWLLLFLTLPYYRHLIKYNRYANATAIVSWVLNLSFYFCFLTAFSNNINGLGLLIYSALFAINYLIGALWFKTNRESWRMPFKFVGLAGISALMFMMTFHTVWSHLRNISSAFTTESMMALLFSILVIGGNALMMLKSQADQKSLLFSLSPLVVGGAYMIQKIDNSGIGSTILINTYMLVLCISVIRTGVRTDRIGVVNIGMLMISALIVARFLDINFSFIIRGLAFVFLGIAFLTANWLMVRGKAGEKNEK